MSARLTERELTVAFASKTAHVIPLRPADDCTDDRFDVTNRAMRPVFLPTSKRLKLRRDWRKTSTIEIAGWLVALLVIGFNVVR